MILVFIIVGLLFLVLGYGIYLTFGPGKTELRDPIDEHAKMHELGIDQYIDHDLQFNKSFLEPLRIILDSIGWEVERTANLEAFFI